MNSKLTYMLASSVAMSAMLTAAPAIAQSPSDVDEVIATGIRASLDRGLDVKRNADSIVDAISAEELGKFPDTNVAESLQRVTGIAITRSRGGEGQFVTVRGLGQEFNILTFKGRELATENAGREFSFDVIPSELISAAQVFKSPTASQTDGSIGGLVNIQTARALDNPGFHGAGQIATQYEGLADDFGFKASGVLSNTFANDTIGIIGSVSFQERDFRTDTAESITIDSSTDFNGDGINDRLNTLNLNLNEEERERIGATLQLEYEPNDNTSFTIDGLYTSFESPSNSDSLSVFTQPPNVINAVVDENNDVIAQDTNFGANETGSAFGVGFTNIFDFVARRANADTETFQIGGNYKQRWNDKLTTELDVSYSEADGIRDNIGGNDGTGSFFVVGFPGLNFSQTPADEVPNGIFQVLPDFNDAPDIVIQNPDAPANNPAVSNIPQLISQLDPAADVSSLLVGLDQLSGENARLHFSRNSSNEISDEVFTISGDAEWEFADENETKLSFGVDYSTREKANNLINNQNTFCGDGTIFLPNVQNPGPNGGIANAAICDRSLGFADFLTPEQQANLITPFNGEDAGFLSSTSANLPRNFGLVDISLVEQAFLNLGQEQGIRVGANGGIDLNGDGVIEAEAETLLNNGETVTLNEVAAFDINTPSTFTITETGTVAELSGLESFLTPVINDVQSFSVEEDIISGYTQLDFGGNLGNFPFRANAGVRVTRTNLTTTGAASDFTSISLDPLATGGSGNNPITVSNAGTQTVSNTFVDVLPSFNIAVDLKENLKARAAFSRSLARPTFNDLSPVLSVTQINEGTESTASGNPNLEAIRSDNIDASLEWYGDNGLSLTGAVFYKSVTDFVANTNNPLDITIPESLNIQTNASEGPQTITFLNSQPDNIDDSDIIGVELAAQYLHDSGFGVLGNVTFADASTSGGTALENISDFSANASIFYENHGLQARISLNHRGEFLATTEGEGGFADIQDDFTQVDFTTSYSLEPWVGYDIAIFAEGQNVFNEQAFTFSERATFLETFIDNGARYIFGVRGSF